LKILSIYGLFFNSLKLGVSDFSKVKFLFTFFYWELSNKFSIGQSPSFYSEPSLLGCSWFQDCQRFSKNFWSFDYM